MISDASLSDLTEDEEAALELLTRERLITRWQCGSDPFFWRAEREGLLVPLQSNGLLRYSWKDVFVFEGGLPPEGMERAYLKDLLTEEKVASLCSCAPGRILSEAKAGKLAARRIGRKYRFVPAEVARWQEARWSRRRR